MTGIGARNEGTMVIRKINGKTPQIGDRTFVAETAAVLGDVVIGQDSSVWYSAVVRGDVNSIEIGDRVSVQDGTVIHVSGGEKGRVRVASDVVIGHNATLHACTVGSHCLIGMGSTVLDGAVVGDGSMVAAHALVLGNTVIGPNELWGGVPAKLIKKITPEFVARSIDRGVESYVEWARIYLENEG